MLQAFKSIECDKGNAYTQGKNSFTVVAAGRVAETLRALHAAYGRNSLVPSRGWLEREAHYDIEMFTPLLSDSTINISALPLQFCHVITTFGAGSA